ncbi:Na+/phosphate symporter [Catenibacillus scindens]|uniref:Na+/phosphate symporter n=1 Tax=Catenibacillus scindens TaxID=673271 RepID=A0A7W8HAC5_9FIRM|nr:hypothetical protein [Catenibacillus scindens]MBB5264694.1 Na+/phosphate symporter [Catenibacillus scindens]
MTTDVIETLSSIDTRASQIMENALARKKALAKEFDEKAQIMSDQIQSQCQSHMEALTRELDEENARQINNLSLQAKEDLAALDENYKTNHDKYVREIFSRIIGA